MQELKERKTEIMTENYKRQWKQINCKHCEFVSYGNNPLCKLTEQEKEELMKSTSCSFEMELIREKK